MSQLPTKPPLTDVKLSIVIPAFNEVNTIEQVVQRVRTLSTSFESEGRQIIVVDDGSTDGTADKLASLASHVEVTVVTHDRNIGKGASIRSALKQVTGNVVIIQDADLEYDPNEYAKLIEPIACGKADVVYGSRFSGGQSHRVLYFWHYVGNRFLTLLSNMLTNLNMTDMEVGYKTFRKDILDQFAIREDGFGVEPEITAKIAKLNCRIHEVGISYAGRTYEEGKKINWKDGLRAIWCIVKYNLITSV